MRLFFRRFLVLVLLSLSLLLLTSQRAVRSPIPWSWELDVREMVEVEEYRIWFQQCTSLFLDLGANRGDTILRWLTEENYNGRAKSDSISKVYKLEERRKFCILSFEPNGMFEPRLNTIQKSMQAKGYKVKVKTRTAVSDIFSDSLIYIDGVSTHSYGTSLFSEKKVNFGGRLHPLGKGQSVKLVDLRAILSCIPKNTELVVKMDIEGGEYDVLRSIVPSGLACAIDLLIIEYHDHKLRKGTVPKGINDVFEWILSGNKCGVNIIHDD